MRRLLLGIGACALVLGSCDGAPPIQTGDDADRVGFALTFVAPDTETACGLAAGVRVTIAREGDVRSCDAMWAPALIGDPYTAAQDEGRHAVADCFFVVPAGTWDIVSVDVLGLDGEILPCCDGAFPATVEVVAAMTSELGVELQCALEGPGALDIYGWLERPPVIVDLDIGPSKFVEACAPIVLDAEAIDHEGDAFDYTWALLGGPSDDYTLETEGSHATFIAAVEGTYTLELTVTDEHGMSTSLVFPVHVTTTDPSCGSGGQDEDCTHTQGFWKNHPYAWMLDSVELGDVVYTAAEALALFDVVPHGDGTIQVAHQLIAAKLNVALGAHGPGLAQLIDAADAFLTLHPFGSGVVSGPEKVEADALNMALTTFNEGNREGVVCLPPIVR
ncbi:MAG: hypothetical protein IT385_12650 [Deltaproteobacteria bacterium]|nr:hypothetical protein [Deltaproteobacteria bacterium]